MYNERGYQVDTHPYYRESARIWEIKAVDDEGRKVLAVFTPVCRPVGDILEIDEYVFDEPGADTENDTENDEEDDDEEEEEEEDAITYGGVPKKKKNGSKEKTTKKFVDALIEYAKSQDIRRVTLVTDEMTTNAYKRILMCDELVIKRFTYVETNVDKFHTHVLQPTLFQKLTAEQAQKVKRDNPRFEREFQPLSSEGPLVRYFGLLPGDIVEVITDDSQTSMSKEHALVQTIKFV